MNIDLTDRDQACIAFMIDQTARQIPFLKQSANEAGCEALDALMIDINNLLAKLVAREMLCGVAQPSNWAIPTDQFQHPSDSSAQQELEAIAPHPCPYRVDIHGDETTLCTCDASRTQECIDDI